MRKNVIPESDDMNLATPVNDPLRFSFHEIILQQGELISAKLNMLRFEHYPPNAAKGLRSFSLSEVAYFLGVTPSNIKKLHLEGKGPAPTTSVSGRRTYSAEQMFERRMLQRRRRIAHQRIVGHEQRAEDGADRYQHEQAEGNAADGFCDGV